MSNRRQQGSAAERLAEAALAEAGYSIVVRNWRCPLGELDLVAQHGADVVAVEVRSRTDGIDAALESVTPAKARRVYQLLQAYLTAHGLENTPARVDVVAISGQVVEIVRDAAGW